MSKWTAPAATLHSRLRAGRYATSLVVLPTDDFPSMTAGTLAHRFHISALTLRGLIDRTRFAISTEETRYYLNGIYLHAGEADGTHVLRAVATDGHRLARVEEPLPEGAAAMPGVIVPRKTIGELRKLLDEATGEVEIALSDTRIQFRVGPVTLTSKLIDGTFPEYERVIPVGNDKVLRVGKKDFSDAVARVAAISSERSRPVKLSLGRDLLVLSAASPRPGHRHRRTGSGSGEIRFDAARNRLPGPLPQRHHGPDRRRSGISLLRRRRPHRRLRRRRPQRPVRADADAGLTCRTGM